MAQVRLAAMDDARALLDQLMGKHRDLDDKGKKAHTDEFLQDKVCKFYLAGFCPADALAGTRKARGTRFCPGLHDPCYKTELAQHKDVAKLRRKYEERLVPKLEELVGEAKAAYSQANRILENKSHLTQEEKVAMSGKNAVASLLHADIKTLRKAAEELAEQGEVLQAQEKLNHVAVMQARLGELVSVLAENLEEDLCEVCGMRFNAGQNAHVEGKIHSAYATAAKMLKDLQEKHKGRDRDRDRDRDRSRDRRSRSRGRRRSRSRSRDRRR